MTDKNWFHTVQRNHSWRFGSPLVNLTQCSVPSLVHLFRLVFSILQSCSPEMCGYKLHWIFVNTSEKYSSLIEQKKTFFSLNSVPSYSTKDQRLFCKGPDCKYFRLTGHMASIMTPQLCCCSAKEPQVIHMESQITCK